MTDLFEAEAATTTTSLDLRRLQRKERRVARHKIQAIVLAVSLALFSVVAASAMNIAKSLQTPSDQVADFPGPGQGTVQVIVNPGDSGSTMATALYAAGVIASEQSFLDAWSANGAAGSGIQPGYYLLNREMRAEGALFALLDTGNRVEKTITVIEGVHLARAYAKIAAVLGVTEEAVAAAAEDTVALGLPDEANGSLEGWLFPSTYRFNPDVTPQEVLAAMVKETIRVLDSEGVPVADRNQVLTVASIIERETLLAVDRPLVASVIYNRLDQGMPLQMDSTITFLTEDYGTVWTTAEARQIDSPYNTYKYTGLPPGPISGAGLSAIQAALEPAETDYLFFVPINLLTGETRYASTYNEHLRNVDILLAWQAENE